MHDYMTRDGAYIMLTLEIPRGRFLDHYLHTYYWQLTWKSNSLSIFFLDDSNNPDIQHSPQTLSQNPNNLSFFLKDLSMFLPILQVSTETNRNGNIYGDWSGMAYLWPGQHADSTLTPTSWERSFTSSNCSESRPELRSLYNYSITN
jgi:hypothetical protein